MDAPDPGGAAAFVGYFQTDSFLHHPSNLAGQPSGVLVFQIRPGFSAGMNVVRVFPACSFNPVSVDLVSLTRAMGGHE